MITIGLVDDEPLFLTGLAMILNSQPDMSVVWQAANGADAVSCHDANRPDILLMDIQMPVMDGLSATRQLIAQDTPSRLIVLTTFDTDEYVLSAIEAGAAGFLIKSSEPAQVITAIRTVHSGEAVISPGPTRRLFTAFRQRPTNGPAIPSREDARSAASLTPRERDILPLIAKGRTNQEICDELWLTMPTIKTHIGNLLSKTHSRDRVQLALFALRVGIADLA